jgi:transposase
LSNFRHLSRFWSSEGCWESECGHLRNPRRMSIFTDSCSEPKKVSTVAAKRSKNFSQQRLTVGLDLGDRNSWYCVLDKAGEIVLEQKLSTTPKAVHEVFGGMPRSRIALETGMHSPWVSRVLAELGHEVIVAHARNVRLIGESRKKDDRLDAQTLARLARIDPQLLSPVKHRSAKAQADLTVIRARAGLVRARTALVNTASGCVAATCAI